MFRGRTTAATDSWILDDNVIVWSGRSPFNDTYVVVANRDLAQAEGGFDLQGMADYLAADPNASVCMESEFMDRPDGLVLFTDATGYDIPESQIRAWDMDMDMNMDLIYDRTSAGECDFGEVYTTDGRIAARNVDLVDDPGVVIEYNLSYTWRDAKFQEHEETYQGIADEILAPLTEEKMTELNAKVDIEDEDAQDVAAEYLQEIGLE